MSKKFVRFAILIIILSSHLGMHCANAAPTCESAQLRRLVNRIGLAEKRIAKMEARAQLAVQGVQKRGRYGMQSAQRQIGNLSPQYLRELAACEDGNRRACLQAESTREIIEGLQRIIEQIPGSVNRVTKLYWRKFRRFVMPLRRKIDRAERFVRDCLQ